MTLKQWIMITAVGFFAGCVQIGGDKPLLDLGSSSASPPPARSDAPASLDDCQQQLERWQSAYQALNQKYEKQKKESVEDIEELKEKIERLEGENKQLREKLDD